MAPVIEGVAWPDAVTVLAGESAAGKTFVALDLAATVVAGTLWHGRSVTAGAAVYVHYEGNIALRLRALRDVAGRDLLPACATGLITRLPSIGGVESAVAGARNEERPMSYTDTKHDDGRVTREYDNGTTEVIGPGGEVREHSEQTHSNPLRAGVDRALGGSPKEDTTVTTYPSSPGTQPHVQSHNK